MLSKVNDEVPEVWKRRFLGQQHYLACGPRDVLIIKANESISSPDIEPRKKGVLTEEDKEKLKRDDIPMEYWEDEIQTLVAKMSMEKRYNILPIEDNPDMTSKYVLEKIKSLFQTTKKPGVCIIYFGSGKKSTGDWCFTDGYITLMDIIELYYDNFKGKFLGIISDCSYSGCWVHLTMKFLDECYISPCLHHAKVQGILLFVMTSCQHDEVPYTLLFANRGFFNDKNSKYFVLDYPKRLEKHQNVRYCGSTVMICGADDIDSECLVPRDYTFKKHRFSQRLVMPNYLLEDGWTIFVVDDDDEILNLIYTGQLDPMDCGDVFLCGEGRTPEEDITEWIDSNYPGHFLQWNMN